MEKKEKISKIQVSPKKSNISKFRNSVSFSSLSNNQFTYFGNNNKLVYEIDKSSSNSSSNSNNSVRINQNTVKYSVVSDPINELKKVNNVIIKVEYQNCCCINQSNNLYNVFTKNKTNIKYLFRAEELMPCTDYSLFKYIQKPFCLNIEHVLKIDKEVSTREFASAQKSCTIPFLCYCRPEIKVKIGRNNNLCGKIVLMFSCGNTEYRIYGAKNKLKYIVDTEYCQPGILCTKNCCGYLPDVIFDILDEKNNSVGTIERRPGAFEEFMRVLDCYQIFFPKNASFEDKFLLICATFMIESEIFRDKWGSLDYCTGCNCDCDCSCECNENCCVDCGYRCCAELFSSLFRF